MNGRAKLKLKEFCGNKLTNFRSMPILGNVEPNASNSHVNGEDVMYSLLLQNNLHKLANNVADRTAQRNDAVTKRFFIKFDEEDIQQFEDMNFTLLSTLRATGATTTSSDNISVPVKHYMDIRLSKDIGNVTLAVSKVRFVTRKCLCVDRIHIKFVFQISYGITSKLSANTTKQDDEEINQFYFYEVSCDLLFIWQLYRAIFIRVEGIFIWTPHLSILGLHKINEIKILRSLETLFGCKLKGRELELKSGRCVS